MERPLITLFPEYPQNVPRVINIPLLCGDLSCFPHQRLKGAQLECPQPARERRNLPQPSVSGCLDTRIIVFVAWPIFLCCPPSSSICKSEIEIYDLGQPEKHFVVNYWRTIYVYILIFNETAQENNSVPSITSDYQRSKYSDIVRSTVLYTGDPGFKS